MSRNFGGIWLSLSEFPPERISYILEYGSGTLTFTLPTTHLTEGASCLSVISVESESIDISIRRFRKQITERYKIATTFGYGPRFLHSTGQLHKGGPPSGLFLHLTVNHNTPLAVPGKTYSFGQLINAQAMGDFQILKQLGRSIVSYQFDSPDPLAAQKLTELISST